MAKNELLPFANGEDANVLPTNQWEALTDILENGFQSGIARSEQVNRVLAQGAVASYVLGQLIVDRLNKNATLDKSALYQNLILALQENAKDACLSLGGGNVTGNLTVQSKNVLRSVNGLTADPSGNVDISTSVTPDYESGISVVFATLQSGYTAPKSGVLITKNICTGNKSRLVLLVDEVQVFYSGYQGSGGQTYISELIVGKGDVVKTSTTEQSSFTCVFYPFKGE